MRLELPERFPFVTEIPIRIGDINYGGHLGHDAVLPIMHEARLRYLISLGYDEGNIEGLTYLMTDAVILYRAQAFYGQTLRVYVAAGDFTRKGCDFYYLLADRDSGSEIVRAKTGFVFYDAREGRTAPVPEAFRRRCEDRGTGGAP